MFDNFLEAPDSTHFIHTHNDKAKIDGAVWKRVRTRLLSINSIYNYIGRKKILIFIHGANHKRFKQRQQYIFIYIFISFYRLLIYM